ncbi:uncharacterized protein [Amphiura filiformis]|uniref:uncharacterized protein n=1 Tax=Amphiura filiformis TaxID=82378 RepID=UPI003B21A901
MLPVTKLTVSLMQFCVGLWMSTVCVLAQRPICQCYPLQFVVTQKSLVAGISSQSGTPMIVRENAYVAFNALSKMAGMLINVTSVDGTMNNHYHVIVDAKKDMWTIDLDSFTCNRTRYRTHFKRCVPDAANYTGSFYVGSRQLFGDEWTFFSPNPAAAGIETLGLLQDSCIPLRATFVGEIQSVQVTASIAFDDYQEGISNPDKFFKIPGYCPLKIGTKRVPVKNGALWYQPVAGHFIL